MYSSASGRNCQVSASKSERSPLTLDGWTPSSGSDCQQGTSVVVAPALPSRSANTHGSECAASSWSESCPVQAAENTPCRGHCSSDTVLKSEPLDCPSDDDATRRLQLLQVEGKYESWGPLLGGVLPSVCPSLLWGQICFDVTTEEQRGCWLLPEELLALQREAAPEEQQERQLFMNTPVSEKEQQAIDQVMLQMLETQQQNQVTDETQQEAETSLQGVQPAWLEQLILRYLHSCSFDRQKTFELLQSTLAFRTEHLPVLESEVYAELRNVGACYWHGRDRKMRPLLIVSLQRLQQLQSETGSENKVTRLIIFCLEFFLRYLCVAGAVESWCVLCDLSGTSITSFPMSLLLNIVQLLQGSYRGRLNRFYILHAPRLFNFIARPVISALPSSTAKKIGVYSDLDDWYKERRAQFASHQIEERFGGAAPDITENWYPFRFFPGPFEPRDSLDSSSGDNGAVRWGSERALHTKVHALVHTGVSLHTSILQKRMAKTKPDTIENSDADRVETMCFRYAAWLHALPEVSLSPSIQDWARDVLRHHLNAHHEHLIQHLRESRHDQRAETQGISDGEPSKVPTTAAVGLSPSNTSPSGDASRTPSPLGESSAGSSAAPTRAVCLPAGASDSLSHHSAQQQNVEPHNHWNDLDVDIVVVASEETAGRITACDSLEYRVTKPPLHALSSSVSDEDAAAPSSVSRSTSAHHTCTARQASPVSLNPTSTIVAVSQPVRSVVSISELRKASWESSLSETARPASDVETQSRANTFPGCRGASVGDEQHAGSATFGDESPRSSPQPGQDIATRAQVGSSGSTSRPSACQQSNDCTDETTGGVWHRLPHGGWHEGLQQRQESASENRLSALRRLESPVHQQEFHRGVSSPCSRSGGLTFLNAVSNSSSADAKAYWAQEGGNSADTILDDTGGLIVSSRIKTEEVLPSCCDGFESGGEGSTRHSLTGRRWVEAGLEAASKWRRLFANRNGPTSQAVPQGEDAKSFSAQDRAPPNSAMSTPVMVNSMKRSHSQGADVEWLPSSNETTQANIDSGKQKNAFHLHRKVLAVGRRLGGTIKASRCVAPVAHKASCSRYTQLANGPGACRIDRGRTRTPQATPCMRDTGLMNGELHEQSQSTNPNSPSRTTSGATRGTLRGASGRLLPLLFFAATAVPVTFAGLSAASALPVGAANPFACSLSQIVPSQPPPCLSSRAEAVAIFPRTDGGFTGLEVREMLRTYGGGWSPSTHAERSAKRPWCFMGRPLYWTGEVRECYRSPKGFVQQGSDNSPLMGRKSYFVVRGGEVGVSRVKRPSGMWQIAPEHQHILPGWKFSANTLSIPSLCMRRAVRVAAVKPKSRGSIDKRFKVTATGKLLYKRPGLQHNAQTKSSARRTRLRRLAALKPSQISRLLGPLSIRR